jgi:glucose uptake protein GlcU
MSGYLLALASAVCNGSFAAAQKLPSVERARPHPVIFNSFVCFGVVVSSLIVMPFLPVVGASLKYNILGSLSGALFVGAILCSFLAIPHLGLAMAQGIWGGSALLVAFLWGVLGPAPVGAVPSSWSGSLGGVLLLVVGILGMVFHESLALRVCGTSTISGDTDDFTPLMTDTDLERDDLNNSNDNNNDNASAASSKNRFLGIFYALLTGVFGGSVNVPSTLTSLYGTKLVGIETLPSFGLGSLVVGLLVPVIYFNIVDKEALQATGGVHFRVLWLPGLISGTVWNLGNICSVYANSDISFAVAQPLMQCALLVSGILGIFVFKEIQGTYRIVTFFSFAVVLLGGAAMLAVFGPG